MDAAFETLESHLCFGGVQQVIAHRSLCTKTMMRVAVYLPPAVERGPCPALIYLSGKTCSEQNFILKAGAQRVAAELGLILVCPDTSPRGIDADGIPVHDTDHPDEGGGATYYIDATEEPWARHYQMYSYVSRELPQFIESHFPVLQGRRSIMGHSMGGHGALLVALQDSASYQSISAFAPVAAITENPACERLLKAYLGADPQAWQSYDACALLDRGLRFPGPLLWVDQGDADPLLPVGLRGDLLQAACKRNGQAMRYTLRPGYDHGYYFIQSFIEEHLRFHHQQLCAAG